MSANKKRAKKQYDVIVYGASGFTGRLVAEYINATYDSNNPPAPNALSWAVAGRNEAKLRAVFSEIDLPEDTPVIIADFNNPDSLVAMVESTKVVITTVGPYSHYGEPLIAACVAAGTDYVDLCGEPLFMREMINKYDAAAKQSGARIVHSCGYDSVPMDLGVWFVQQAVIEKQGKPSSQVRVRIKDQLAGGSGGSGASFKATAVACEADPSLQAIMDDAFALCPGFSGLPQPDDTQVIMEKDLDSWAGPFFMATINSKNVHRTNFLLDFPYGQDFTYSEMVMGGSGDEGKAKADFFAAMEPDFDAIPQGEGPSKELREAGFYNVLFIAKTENGLLTAEVTGDRDPGYGSTAKIVAETGVCLALGDAIEGGGVLTAAAIMAGPLLERLRANAGLTFELI